MMMEDGREEEGGFFIGRGGIEDLKVSGFEEFYGFGGL